MWVATLRVAFLSSERRKNEEKNEKFGQVFY